MAISIAKTRSTQSRAFTKFKGITFFIKRNIDANTGDLKIFHTKICQNMAFFKMLPSASPIVYVFCLQPFTWRAMNVTVLLAPKYQGQSLSVQCYEFFLHTIFL